MNLDAKVTALINAADAPAADSVPDKEAGAPPTGSASGAESAAGATGEAGRSSPTAPASPPAATTMADLFAEKLAKVREQRQASTQVQQAKAQREHAARIAAEAAEDRKAAAEERARWENLKSGNILETLKAAGRDPAQAFAEMQREAIEAGTPEAQLKRMRAEMDRQLAETVEPLQKTIEELKAERDAARASTQESAFASDFQKDIGGEAYRELRIEYPDDRLLAHAKNFRDNPKFFYSVADEHKVRLTSPGDGFTMVDILNTLRAVQDAHRAGTESRRAALAPPPSGETQQSATSPTVNGTAERRNAGATTIGNDLTTARAADGKFVPKGSTAAQRLRERTRRIAGE